MKKMYCLVVTDDYSRFTWVFFLATKDETSGILKSFITGIENLVDHKVKMIRCDNGTEFKNREMNQFCEMKGILRQFSVARTPQQNGVAERRNRTPIKASRTILTDSKTPTLSFMRPFGCPVTILNTIDHLGKFDGKADEGFFVGYSLNSKAFRVFNSRTRIVEENLHIRFSESTPNVVGSGPDWLFDIDALTRTMNYEPIVAGTQSNGFAGTKASDNAGQARKETEPVKDYILLPLWTADPPYFLRSKDTNNVNAASTIKVNVPALDDPNMPALDDISIFDLSRDNEDVGGEPKKGMGYNAVPPPPTGLFAPLIIDLSHSGIEKFKESEFEGYGPKAIKMLIVFESKTVKQDVVSDGKLKKKTVFPTAAKIEVVKPKQQEKPVRKPVKYAEMYRSQKPRENQRNWNNLKSQQLGSDFVMNNKACFACRSFNHLIKDCKRKVQKPNWSNAIKLTLLSQKAAYNAVKRNRFNAVKHQHVGLDAKEQSEINVSKNISASVTLKRLITLMHKDRFKSVMDLMDAQAPAGGKSAVKKKKNPRREEPKKNKARLIAQGYTQEEGIDYDEVFAPVARIEAIRLFLAYASFKDFVVYQIDVKSAFLYEKIEEEVYVCQPPGFEDPDFPDRVYKVEKALYGLHQAPRAWYETLSTYLLDNGFQRGKIDKNLFIKRHKGDILLVKVYVDNIIFGSIKKELCFAFEKLMHERFQISSMGELTFFLGLQVKQSRMAYLLSINM
ncbi:retrovirus-related pol polyprotein from transposon TNT 1-94 [Tanacetum coccineum]